MGKNVVLAGYNVDKDLLDEEYFEIATPETICAAYARASRSPSTLHKLRANALKDVTKARASNEQIIFDYGHASIAEHAYFNFDIFDISRLAVEFLEHTRLASYTEQSQRYQKNRTLIVNCPSEIASLSNPTVEETYYSMIAIQQTAYMTISNAISAYLRKKYGDGVASNKLTVREDARYILPLATSAPLGMSINGRSLEYTISRLRSSNLLEVVDIGNQLYEEARQIAPSLFRYCKPNLMQSFFDQYVKANVPNLGFSNAYDPKEEVVLLHSRDNGDKHLLATIISTVLSMSYTQSQNVVNNMSYVEQEGLFKHVYTLLDAHTSPPRQWETIQFNFELLVSASCFAQLKRHRMGTIIASNYDPDLGVTIPASIEEAGCSDFFMSIMDKTNETYYTLVDYIGENVASYILTNAHKRRVYLTMNLRELYNFMRLRLDKHAQWDIRRIANKMKFAVQENMPLGAMLLQGKDSF